MDPVWLLLLLPLAAASGWLTSRVSTLRWRKHDNLSSVYLRGINFLMNEQHEKGAIKVFLDMLEADSQTVEIQLSLGSLFRRRGEIENATMVHESLVLRKNLTGEQRMQALFELGQDYYVAGLFDRAERFFTDLKRDRRHAEQAHEYLRHIYEQEREWGKCIEITRKLGKLSSKDYQPIMAQYYCELTEEAIADGSYDEAENKISEALRTDDQCVRAILQSGRLKAIQGDHREAIEIWRTIESTQPNYMTEIVDLVTASYQALGETKKLEDFLRTNAEAVHDAQLVIAYVDALESSGGSKKAEEYLTNWIRRNPSLYSFHRLILLKLKGKSAGISPKDFELIEDMVSHAIKADRKYECQRCGYVARNMHWQCPGCRSWNSIKGAGSQTLIGDASFIDAK